MIRTLFSVPGTGVALTFERAEDGRISRLACEDVCYLDASIPFETAFGDGFVRTQALEMPNALMRTVFANGRSWTETYRWSQTGEMLEVDDIRMSYDSGHRVTACRGPEGDWFYGYSGDQLTVIDGPRGLRQIVRDAAGRPVRVRESRAGQSFEYPIHHDAAGQRLPRPARPCAWHFDDLGRLWSVTAPGGRVLRTYLWTDYHCFGRIDGPPGDPLAAVFSLDLTGTPVRVIERGSMRRLPRDAFGESLLDERGVPGLYGGAVDNAFVRLPYRRLDPRTGSFDSPDPFTGLDEDPRRAAGYAGPLLAELAKAGPYTVARHNPLSLADPTGAISDLWWYIPSALTWSYQNTVGSILGMWLTIDFLPALFVWLVGNVLTLFLNDNLREAKSRFFGGVFDIELLSAKNFDAFALRSGGILDLIQEEAWTYQFLVNESGNNLTKLQFARLFQPDADFTPDLYGTVLHCAPSSGQPFLLNGQRRPPNGAELTSWARNGGPGQAAFPGSFEPVFPAGALHFASVMNDRVCPQTATIAELIPQAPILGTATSNRAQGEWSGDAQGAAAGQVVALIGTAVDIVTIAGVTASGSNTIANFQTPAPAVVGQRVRLRGLGAPVSEGLVAHGTRNLIVPAASTRPYAVDAVVRTSLGGAVVQRATIVSFESSVNVDIALPGTFVGAITVFQATASGSFAADVRSARDVFLQRGTLPVKNDGIVVGTIPAIVSAIDPATRIATVNRDLGPLGATRWRNLTRATTDIGTRAAAADPAPIVTYVPRALHTAPATGFLWCESGGDIAVRIVTGRDFDGIVISADLPDPAATYDVELFTPLATPDIADVLVSITVVAEFSGPTAAGTRAFHVMEFNGPGIAARVPALVTGAALAGQNLTSTFPASNVPALAPSNVIILGAGGTLEAAVVSQVQVVVTFMTAVPGRDTGLEASLVRRGPPYAGDLADPADLRRVRVRPELNGDRVDMPRFFENELVRVSWGAVAPIDPARERFYRITRVDGATIDGDGDAPIDPAAPIPLRVEKLVAADPETGGRRLGLDGRRAAPDMIQFAVWTTTAFRHEDIVVILGDVPVARRVRFPTTVPVGVRNLTVVLVSPTALVGPIDISSPDLLVAGGVPGSRFTTGFRLDAANHVEFTDANVLPGGGAVFVAVPYIERAPRTPGKLKAGSVRVPDDHENAGIANTRREALVDHELVHSTQSARLGPWLFAWWPNWLAELIGETALGMGGPDYSRTIDGKYNDEAASLEITAFADISLDSNQTVQVSQDGRTANVRVRTRREAVFSLNREDLNSLSSGGIRPGTVGVRKQQTSPATAVYEKITKATELLTVGGIMNVLSTASYGGIISLVGWICQKLKKKSEVTFSASVTSDTVVTAEEGVTIAPLETGMTIEIRKGSNIYLRKITDIALQAVTLDRAIPLTGAVELAMYDAGSAVPGDPNKYVPGTAEDRNRPAVIKVPGLELDADDRIIVRTASGQSRQTKVTAKNADGTVEIEEPVLIGAASSELLVAKLRRDDPMGSLDQLLLNKLNVGFLQFLHDPYGQIRYTTRPTSTVGKVLTRSARYLFGTKMWGLPFLTGYFWWDNAYRRLGTDEPELSAMEQEASFRSGDTYCPVATLHGTIDTVGDVARYWLTADGGRRDGIADMILTEDQDAPGVHARQFHALAVSTATRTGYSVPDVFADKDVSGRDWTGVSSQGWIPIDGELERSSGSYVAFSRPPVAGASHTIDARNISGLTQSRNAQAKGPSGVITSPLVPVKPFKRNVRVSFPKALQDVTVTIALAPVAEGDVVRLIPFQAARVDVSPGGARQYRVTVSQPGLAARVPADTLTLEAVRAAVGTRDFVEISRFYPLDAADPTRVVGIGPMHLAAPVHVAVRRLEIEISDQLIVTANIVGGNPPITEARAGDTVFLLVPAPPFQTPPPVIPNAVTVNPAIDPDTTASDASRELLGTAGVAFKIVFAADAPPEADVTVTFNWRVGVSVADSAPVTASFPLRPHFVLSGAGGAALSVARGGTITLESSDGTLMSFESGGAGVSLNPTQPPTANQMTLLIDAGAAPGPRTIVVKDTDPARPARFARQLITVT